MHVSEGQLYAATVADFSGGEPLIHREKIRTERSDLNQLNGNFLKKLKFIYKLFTILYIRLSILWKNIGNLKFYWEFKKKFLEKH